MMSSYPISGLLPPKFEAVRQAIAQNREQSEEMGFQFCLMQNGELLIDICAGFADKAETDPIRPDHLFSVYSSGKAMAALTIAHLAEHDRLGYEQNILTLWPDFEAGGKGELSIAQILSHQAGLSGITKPDWSGDDWYDWDKTCAQLAAQEPLFPPGSASGYSPIIFGYLAGEIARAPMFG